jgi:hypothetical protein
MITLAIGLTVGYTLIIGLCRMAARADRVSTTWEEPALMQVAARPIPPLSGVLCPITRAD